MNKRGGLMKRLTRKQWITVGIFCLLLVALGGFLLLKDGSPSVNKNVATPTKVSSISVTWATDADKEAHFTPAEKEEIAQKLNGELTKKITEQTKDDKYVILGGSRQDQWADLSVDTYPPFLNGQSTGEPFLVIIHKADSNLKIWTPGSDDFCDGVKQMPDKLFPSKNIYFGNCYQ
jgi:hypothetical protein